MWWAGGSRRACTRGYGEVALQLGELLIDFSTRTVRTVSGGHVRLGARATEVLLTLAEHCNRFVSRHELMRAVWPGLTVDEANLSVQVSALRKVLSGYSRSVIQASSGRGYRLVLLDESATPVGRDAADHLPAALRGSIPPRRNLFGRAGEVETTIRRLSAGRIVSICGATGIGTTTIAVEVAHRLADAFGDGIAWIDLSESPPGAGIIARLSGELTPYDATMPSPDGDVGPGGRQDDRKLLLVLDDCEPTDGTFTDMVQQLHDACPHVSLLITARAPLGLDGERVVSVGGLQVPDEGAEPAQALRSPALLMFLACLDRVMPNHPVDADFIARAGEVCRRMDGVPLGLELAANAAAELGWEAFTRDLANRIGDARVVAPRGAKHDSLESAIALSYSLLSESERWMVRRLSVFSGSFSVQAAADVVGHPPGIDDVGSILASLARKSFLTVADVDGDRYAMLATQRSFAAKRNQESGDEAVLRERHAAYFARDMEWIWLKRRAASDHEITALLTKDQENRRAATEWALSAGMGRLALANIVTLGTSVSLDSYEHGWAAHCVGQAMALRSREADLTAFDTALVLVLLRLPASALKVDKEECWGILDRMLPLLREQGRADILIPALINRLYRLDLPGQQPDGRNRAEAALRDILDLIQDSGLTYEMPRWLRARSTVALIQRQFALALASIRDSVRLSEAAGQMVERLNSRINEIVCLRSLGRHREALAIGFAEMDVQHVSPVLLAYIEGNVGAALVAIGDRTGAKLLLRRAFAYLSGMDSRFFVTGHTWILVHFAKCRFLEEQLDDAALLLGASLVNRLFTLPSETDIYEALLASLRERLGEVRVFDLMERGKAMDAQRIRELLIA